MKKLLSFSFVLALLLVLAACGGGSSSSPSSNPSTNDNSTSQDNKSDEVEVIKIGVIAAETGPASTLGRTQVNTVKLMQKQLDEMGPINGVKVQLILEDYETDDTKAVIAMDKLISEGVVAVIGATQASTTMAVAPKAIAEGIPLMATAPAPTNEDYVFYLPPSNPAVASQIIDFLLENNLSKVAWLNARDAFGVDGLPSFEDLAKENNIEIVAHEEFDATATDMTIQLTNVRSKNPDVVVVWSRTPGAGIVARNFKALDFDIPMIQSTAAANEGFLEQVKDDNDNIFVIGSKLSVVDQMPDSPQKERLLEFRDAFKAEFNSEPDLFAAHAYDGILLLLEAIKAGHTNSADIQNFIKNDLGEFPGITGTFDYTTGRVGPAPDGLSVLSIENNQWKYND